VTVTNQLITALVLECPIGVSKAIF